MCRISESSVISAADVRAWLMRSLDSAYKEEFGCNFTSAIPTNVFGPNDNL